MSDDYETATRLMLLLEHEDAGHALRLAEVRERFDVDDACAGRYRRWVGQHRVVSDNYSHPSATTAFTHGL